MRFTFGRCIEMYVTDTLHVGDYSQYRMDFIEPEPRYERHRTIFPEECRKAFMMGASFAREMQEMNGRR